MTIEMVCEEHGVMWRMVPAMYLEPDKYYNNRPRNCEKCGKPLKEQTTPDENHYWTKEDTDTEKINPILIKLEEYKDELTTATEKYKEIAAKRKMEGRHDMYLDEHVVKIKVLNSRIQELNYALEHGKIPKETCRKYWDYRADSGHLWMLLHDLLGEEFVKSHSLTECIIEVRNRWDESQGVTI